MMATLDIETLGDVEVVVGVEELFNFGVV